MKGSHHVTVKSTHFAVSKDEWDTKENTGKFMKNALYVLHSAQQATGQCKLDWAPWVHIIADLNKVKLNLHLTHRITTDHA